MHRILTTVLFSVFLLSATMAQDLVEASLLETKSALQIRAFYQNFFPVANGARFYKLRYTTPDLEGVTDTVAGILIVPDVEGEAFPLLVDQHITAFSKDNVPSNGNYFLAEVLAANGYITMSSDLLGLGESRGFHPYVHAASEASAAIDMLEAVRTFLDTQDIPYTNQLFLAGYSQGGHGAAALHRELEANYTDRYTVTAAAHSSGPYSISGVFRNFILSDQEYSIPALLAYTILSYDLVYDLYDDVSEYFKPPYSGYANEFFNWQVSLDSLNLLMVGELLSRHGAVIPKLMLQDSIVDILANRPDHPLRQAMRDNDLVDWAPQAPTRLFYCMADDWIPFRNTIVADSAMNDNGAPDLSSRDVLPFADHINCFFPAVNATLNFFEPFRDLQTRVSAPRIEEVDIFPNPAVHVLHLRHLPENCQLQLYDTAGKSVKSLVSREANASIDLSDLPAGIYFIRIQTPSGLLSRKVVLSR